MPHVHAHRGRKRSHLGDAHQLLPCAPPSPTPPPLRVARAVHERRGLRPLAALPAPLRPRLRRSDRTADRMPVYERQWGRRAVPQIGGHHGGRGGCVVERAPLVQTFILAIQNTVKVRIRYSRIPKKIGTVGIPGLKEANTDWPYSTNQPERCAARPPRAASIPQPQPGARRSRLHLARLRRPRLASCFSSRGSPCATRSPIRCRHGDDAKRGHLDVGDEGSSRSAPGSRFAGAASRAPC